MPILSLPTVWSTDQILTAAALNGEFTAVANVVNALDHANVGAAGFYASNIIPTSSGQAQFGGAQTYTFPAGVTIDGALNANTASFSTASFVGGVTMNSTLGVSGFAEVGSFNCLGNAVFSVGATVDGNLAVGGTLGVSVNALISNVAIGVTPTAGQVALFCASSMGYLANQTSISCVNDTNSAYIPSVASAFNVGSDSVFKENIRDCPYGLHELEKLTPRAFEWKGTSATALGFVAQELATVLPELITKDHADRMLVNYDGLIPILVNAIIEQQAQIDELKRITKWQDAL